MNAGSPTANAYLRTKVLTASPEELRLMLLDGAIRFATQGRDGLARKDYEASYNGMSQCRNIIIELITSIRPDVDPELAQRVRSVYTFMFSELVEASFQKDPARVDEVLRLLNYERETWAMLMGKLAQGRAGDAPPAAPRPASAQAKPAAFSVEA
ncbi:MAG: flagellar export chaperone FliS [Phycisphaerales bacterium]